MSIKAWFPWYPSDYERNTKLLSDEADLLYRRILDVYWQHQGVLPYQLRKIAKVSRFNWRKFQRVWPEIEHYFSNNNGLLFNKRMDEEITRAIEKSNKARESVMNRYSTNVGTNVGTNVDKNNDTNEGTHHNHNHNHNIKEYAQFSLFWETYPKKKDKTRAEKAFKKLNPDEPLFTTMLKALGTQKLSSDWKKENGQFVPYPASWINGRRWEDESNETADDIFKGSI